MAVSDLRVNRASETVGIYALGFLDAAVALFERADEGQGLVDLTFYPAAYCLRHGLELLAKQMKSLRGVRASGSQAALHTRALVQGAVAAPDRVR